MRVPILVILPVVLGITAAPARAQTYDPRYPVCIEVATIDGSHIDCRFASLGQCAVSASGRAASCFANPYFAGKPAGPSNRPRRAQ